MPANISGVNLFAGQPSEPLEGTGRVFWVGNSSTYVPGGVAGTDNAGAAGDTPQRPFATIDYAIGQCTASRGDVIYVLPGHAETVSGTIAADVAGVRIIGLGVGSLRPTLTFDTTSDVLDISAANVEVANLIFVCNVANLTRFIYLDADGDGAWIHGNLFREGSATGLSMVEWEGAADDVRIEDNQFFAPTAGNYDEAILIASTPTRGRIRRNFIYGDFDEGAINNATGNIATLFEISDNVITNLLAGAEAIDLDSAVTGVIANNSLSTDVLSTSIDQGSMRCIGNLWSSTTDGTHGVAVPATPADTTTADTVLGALIGTGGVSAWANAAIPAANVSIHEVIQQLYAALEGTAAGMNGVATWPTAAKYANNVSIAEVLGYVQDAVRNGTGTAMASNKSVADALGTDGSTVTDGTATVLGPIGAQNNNNAFVSTSVVSNRDGSVLERLEYLVDTSGDYLPNYGYHVIKVGDVSAAPDDLFTVTGKVLVTLVTGEVTSVIATTQSLSLLTSTGGQVIVAASQIDGDSAGTLYIVSGDPDLALNGGGTPGLDAATLTNGSIAPFLMNDDKIYQSVNGAGTGTIQWDLYYVPLEASASVASSA